MFSMVISDSRAVGKQKKAANPDYGSAACMKDKDEQRDVTPRWRLYSQLPSRRISHQGDGTH